MPTLPRSSTPLTAARTTRTELRRHLSFATRAPPPPEFHLLPELHRHPSFTTRDHIFQCSIFNRASSSPELRDQSSTFARVLPFTRASPSSELRDQRSTFFTAPSSPEIDRHLHFATRPPPALEIRRHLSSPLVTRASRPEPHLSSELHLYLPRLLRSLSFPFNLLPTVRHHFFWPLPLAPASSTPSARTIWELLHQLLQPPRRWDCRFKPLPAARRPLPGHYHHLRRHRTTSADQRGHISLTPAATTSVGLLVHSATNRSRRHHHRRQLRALSITYSSNYAVIFAA